MLIECHSSLRGGVDMGWGRGGYGVGVFVLWDRQLSPLPSAVAARAVSHRAGRGQRAFPGMTSSARNSLGDAALPEKRGPEGGGLRTAAPEPVSPNALSAADSSSNCPGKQTEHEKCAVVPLL